MGRPGVNELGETKLLDPAQPLRCLDEAPQYCVTRIVSRELDEVVDGIANSLIADRAAVTHACDLQYLANERQNLFRLGKNWRNGL